MKNFFIKLWEYIKKGFKVSVQFFKENIWASVLGVILAIVLFIMALQGIIKAIDSCDNDTIQNRATVVTSSQLEKMFDEEKHEYMFWFSCLDPALSSRQLNNRGFPLIFLK